MSDVLVDSSVWIDFFRGDRAVVARLDPLIAEDRAAVAGMIVAEVSSGARTTQDFRRIKTRLRALHALVDPPDLWDAVAELRFALARGGVQAHLVDLALAVTANAHGHALLTRDEDFVRIARALPLDVVCF